MSNRDASFDAARQQAAAQAAVAGWWSVLSDLERWFESHAHAIWPEGGRAGARDTLGLLRDTLSALARGETAVAARPLRTAAEPPRIDALLATGRAAARPAALARAEERRRALLKLALWDVLRAFTADSDVGGETGSLSRLHARLAQAVAPVPGVSPAFDYAATPAASAFFNDKLRRVLEALAKKAGGDGAVYAGLARAAPFDGGLPSLVEWSRAWSAAVAGVYLDNLQRHGGDDVQQVLRELWSGRLDAVRFRAGPGLTALPTHAGSLHLELWTCVLKAQALAFDAARWGAHADGTRWHGVRIDMHELSAQSSAGRAPRAVGVGIESLYRIVFIDRLRAALDAGASTAAAPAGAEHTIAIDMDRPDQGHVPNLRLLLRWREPGAGPLRRAAPAPHVAAEPSGALQRWLQRQGVPRLAYVLAPQALDWRAPTTKSGQVLGHAALWAALAPAVQWIDPALVVGVDGEWYELPVTLDDDARDGRSAWRLGEGAALPGGLDVATLARAAHTGALRWVANDCGLGAFVMAAIDVDAWRSAQRP